MKPFQYKNDVIPQNRIQISTQKTMKTNATSSTFSHRSPFVAAALAACVLMSALVAPSSNAADGNPPNRISYKGYLTDASGDPLEENGPINHVIVFRIYNVLQGGTAIWTEQQTVTIDKGVFSVLLGAGTQHSSESHDLLHTVFQGNDASDRYIGITVDSAGSELAPRMQFLASAYAQLARNAVTADSLNNGFVNTIEGGGIEILDSSGTPTSRTPQTPWHLSSKTVLSATQGIYDWHMMMEDTNGDLQWADANSADGRLEMELRTGSGNLWIKGQLLASESVVVDNSTVTLPAGSGTTDREFFRVQRGGSRWNMFTDSSGHVYWANENYDGAHPHFSWKKNGDFKAQGRITANHGVLVDNSNTTPAARAGAFNPAWKRVLTATQGINDWHIMMDDVPGAGNLLFADANALDGALEMILQRGSGNLTIKGQLLAGESLVVTDSDVRLPVNPTNGDREFFRVNRGTQAWHMFTDFSGAMYFAAENYNGTDPHFAFKRDGSAVNINGWHQFSDRRMKKNIEKVEKGMLEKVVALQPVRYHLKQQDDSEPRALGLIAQDVQELFPDIVATLPARDPNLGETLALSYDKVGVLAVGAIKELNEEVKLLREEKGALSDQLRGMLARLNALEKNSL
jgi:hypothetical protein